MRRDITKVILAILTLNLFFASTTLAQGTVVSVNPSLIQDHDIKPGAPIMKSYPAANNYTATVANPTNAYDKNPTTYATVTPPSTSWTYFNVKTFNSSLTKQYIALNLNVNFSVTCKAAYYKFSLYVGSKSTALELLSNVNVTTPTVKTWTAVVEPNDCLWSQADINNMQFRVEVRKSSTSGWLTFLEYEAWVSIPIDSFVVGINIADVTGLVNWQFNLTFNPDVLQAVTVKEGLFLKQVTSTTTLFPDPVLNNTAGWVSAGASLYSYSFGGASGSGVLATVCFKAISEGNSVLNFDEASTKLRSWDGSTTVPIDYTTVSGFFQYLVGDANNDGVVNGADISVFSVAYGTTPSSPNWNTYCDFNRDNKVIVSDLYDLGKHYGQT